MKKDFAIIGLGAFGQRLCRELSEKGADVIAIDRDEERVNAIADEVTFAYCCDCTKKSALAELNLQDADNVVVAIGDRLESLILTVILLKELGVKRIVARAEEDNVKEVLLHLGVDEVIDTRELAVSNLSYRLISRSVTQYFEVTEEHSVATIRYEEQVPSPTLLELDLRNKYNLNILLIRRGTRELVPSREDRFEPGDYIVLFGTNNAIKRIDKRFKF